MVLSMPDRVTKKLLNKNWGIDAFRFLSRGARLVSTQRMILQHAARVRGDDRARARGGALQADEDHSASLLPTTVRFRPI